MKLIIASNNAHKITEIEALLASISIDLPVVSLQEIGDVPEIVEDGTTFEENAVKKVETIAKVALMITFWLMTLVCQWML